LKCYRTRWKII